MTQPPDKGTWPNAGSRSHALYRRACEVLPGGNTRTTVYFPPYPIYAERGEGAYVIDVDGVRRLDVVNNYTSMLHGHRYPVVEEAVIAQMRRIGAVGLPTEPEVALAELLVSRVPSFERVRFVNSGTEAVMTAVRAARAYTRRFKIAKVEGAYHGAYEFVETSQASTPDNWGPLDAPQSTPLVPGTPPGVLDHVVVIPFNRTEQARRLIEQHATELAAVVIDPMPNRVGVIPATAEYLTMLREVTRAHGIVLLFDEVISFRLGYAGAQGELDVTPDLTAIGKIVGGGFPVGAIAGGERLMSVFDPSSGNPVFPHGGTFNANPVTMAAGLAAMSLWTPKAVARVGALGERVRREVRMLFERHGVCGQVSGAGSLVKLHFRDTPLVDYRSARPDAVEGQAFARLFGLLLEHGVFSTPTGFMCLSTVMGEREIDVLVGAIDVALERIASEFTR